METKLLRNPPPPHCRQQKAFYKTHFSDHSRGKSYKTHFQKVRFRRPSGGNFAEHKERKQKCPQAWFINKINLGCFLWTTTRGPLHTFTVVRIVTEAVLGRVQLN